MNKRRRESESPERKKIPADEHGFGIFCVEHHKDAVRVLEYLSNPTNAALVVLAPGIRKKDLALPRPSKKRKIRVVRREELAGLLERGEFLPRHWRHQHKKETK